MTKFKKISINSSQWLETFLTTDKEIVLTTILTNDTVTTTKTKPMVEVNCFKQWNKYCHLCGVKLSDKHGSKDCPQKKTGHKDDTTFLDRKGDNIKRDQLWNMWRGPVTHYKFTELPIGAKNKPWWCWRDISKEKNKNTNNNNKLLRLNPTLLSQKPSLAEPLSNDTKSSLNIKHRINLCPQIILANFTRLMQCYRKKI